MVGKFAGLGCLLGAAHGGFPLFQNLFRCAVNRKKKKKEIFFILSLSSLFFKVLFFGGGHWSQHLFFKASPRDLSAILFLGTWRTFNKSFHTFLFFWCWEGKIGSLLGEHLGHWITSQTWIPSSFLVRNLSLVWRTIFPRERNQNRDSSLPMWMKKMISPLWSKLMRFFPERQRIPPSSQTAWCQTRRGLDNLSSGLWHFFMSLPPSFFSFVYYTLCFFFSQDPQQVWKGRRISVCKRWRREKAFRHFSWPRRGNFPMISSSSSHLTLPGQFFFLVWLSKSFYDSLTRSHALNSLDSKRLDSFFFL